MSFIENPIELHLVAAKRIFRYLKGMVDFGVFYKKESKSGLFGCIDTEYAGDQDDRRSTLGYVFMMGSGAVA